MEEWERLVIELRAELTLREQELDLLHEIDLRLLATDQLPEDLFSFIVARTRKLFQANHATILLRRSTFLEPVYSTLRSAIGQRIPIPESLTGLCLEIDTTLNIANLGASPYSTRYAPLRGYRGSPMRSLLATPIRIHGTSVGVLNIESTVAGIFKAVHERIATAVAAEIAVALERTQTLASSVLFADVDRLMFTDDYDTPRVIQLALEQVMSELQRLEHVRHTGAQIMFLRGQNELEIVHSTNPLDIGLTLPVDHSIGGRAVRERRTVVVGDVNADPEYHRLLGDSIRSQIAVPILFGEDDIVIGVLSVESEEVDAFFGFNQLVLESFAEKVRTLLAFTKLRADVTEALELRSANDLLAAVGDQTSHMIHRLNNSVGAMRFRIKELQSMLENGRLEGDFLKESLAALLSLAERTLKMPDDVTGLLSGDSTSVDVNECVQRAIGQVDLPGNIILDITFSPGIPNLNLYSFDIVVQNLLQNAIDAMPDGGRLTVSTAAILNPVLQAGYFQFVVRDTGKGIPIDIQRRVFDLNFTTKAHKGQGLGLGLWWVRIFVRRARGDVTIRSTPGSGTEVTVKIPIDRPQEDGIADE